MALSRIMLKTLAGLLKPGALVASIGYPDVISPPEELQETLGKRFDELTYRDDSEAIAKWHGTIGQKAPDSYSFFSLLGACLDVFDIAAHRGGEIIRDFNYPLPIGDLECYDFVLDVGTAEHCANIAQAFINMAGLLKVGGFILHENPHSGWNNHGFYSIHPTFYHDFYTSNGFEILKCLLIARDGQQVEVPATARFIIQGESELNMLCVAHRIQKTMFQYPTQTKYRKSIPAAGISGEQQKELSHG